jgi:glutamyl-tRNA reductase
MTRSAALGAAWAEPLLAVGVSHRTAPLALLDRLALSRSSGARVLAELGSDHAIHEAVALSTCNRTELYLVASDYVEAERVALGVLSRQAGVRPTALVGRVSSLRGPDAVRHLFRVTGGLESMVVGETEIQGQVKRAYELARLEGATGPMTTRLFRDALSAGRRVRSEIPSCRSRVSVASVAVGLAARRFGGLEGRTALVIGAGENGELTGHALAGRGSRVVFVAHRRYERAEALARRFTGRAVGSESLRAELVQADLAFSCTSSPHQVLARDELAHVMEQRAGRALVLVDIAVPRDIDPAARDLPHVALYDIHDVKREVTGDVNGRAEASARAGPLIEREVERFQAWLVSLEVLPAISALHEQAEARVEEVLREHVPGWASLSTEDRERVGIVAHAVVNRFLHEPTVRLKRASGSRASSAYVQALWELFGLERTAPAADDPLRRSTAAGR